MWRRDESSTEQERRPNDDASTSSSSTADQGTSMCGISKTRLLGTWSSCIIRLTKLVSCKVIGLSPHTDGTALTLLLHINDVQGLQIRRDDGKWLAVYPLGGAFLVSIGDIFENPAKCKLLYNASGRVLEVAKGRAFPELHVLRDCPIHQGYAVVALDHVYDDSAHFTLEFPPDDQTVTLGDARYGRVQWRRAHIVVADASTPDSSPSPHSQHVAASSNPQPLLELTPRVVASPQPPPLSKPPPAVTASSQHEPSPPDVVASCLPPRSKSASNVAALSLRPPRQPAQRGKKSSPKKACQVNKAQSGKISPPKKIADVWIKDHPKYKPGKALLSADELRNAGAACIQLHNYYTQRVRDRKPKSIVLKYNQHHFLSTQSYFLVSFGDMYGLFNLDTLDVSLLRCFTLHLMKEMKGPCAFVDPAPMTIDNLHDDGQGVVKLLVKAIRHYKDKEYIMFPHNTGGHWVLDIAFPESPFEDAVLHNIRDRIASFLVNECINRKGEFFCTSNE
ncbi:hypothetical protein EJB05_13192, partial [Eragrostis curvula]